MRELKITSSITNRDSESLERYLQEVSKLSLITPEEEDDLAKRIRAGDEEAIQILAKSNLRFVVSVAKQYQRQGLTLSDLINEGNLGLLKACHRFDETKGFKFISYAVWWIRQMILAALAENARIVRLPLNKVGLYSKVGKAFNTLEQEYEREPTIDELSDMLGVSEREIEETFNHSYRHISLDAPLHDEEETTMGDKLDSGSNTFESMNQESLRKELQRVLQSLTPREAEILTANYRLDGEDSPTLKEVEDRYCLTKERVRQIKEKALRRIQAKPRVMKLLKAYLG